jgi:hypothetical protein
VQCACSREKKVLVIAFELVIGYTSDVIAIASTGGVFVCASALCDDTKVADSGFVADWCLCSGSWIANAITDAN